MQNENTAKSSCLSFFAASNSGHGFISYFDKVFCTDTFNTVYILKGGPGTGKSSLMKAAEKKALSLGYKCEVVLCSSDPYSYDGVIINKNGERYAILDGTAPHTADTEIPGAIDKIINLGEFWSGNTLKEHRERICTLIKKKSRCYSSAYSVLRSAESYAKEKRNLLCDCINQEKLSRTVKRLLSKSAPNIKETKTEYKLKFAISAEGYSKTDIFEKEKGLRYALTGAHGASFAFFDILQKEAEKYSLPVILSPSALSPDTLNAIALPTQELYFYEAEDTCGFSFDKTINTERFLIEPRLREIKPTLRLLSRLEKDAVSSAVKLLKEAKKYHFELEEIYTCAMDFDKKEKMQEKMLSEIFEQ